MKKGILLLLCSFTAVCSPVWAQSTGSSPVVSGKLGQTLGMLKESVDRLREENKTQAVINEQLRSKIRDLNEMLKRQEVQGAGLSAQFDALEPRYQKKMTALSLLEEQIKNSVEQSEVISREHFAVVSELNSREQASVALMGRIGTLSREVTDIRSGLVLGEDRTAELDALRVSQAALQKELDLSAADLERMRGEWQRINAVISAGPGQVDVLKKDQASLKGDIGKEKQELAALQSRLAAEVGKLKALTTVVYAKENVDKLEAEVLALDSRTQGLEKEAAALERDNALRVKKNSSAAEIKRKKEESRVKELSDQHRFLREELTRLNREMVLMDKKKAALEKVSF